MPDKTSAAGDEPLAGAIAPLIERQATHDDAATDRQVVFSPRADGGMGFTLADGIASIHGWDLAFVGLADMPWVSPTKLRMLLARARSDGAGWDILQPLHFRVPGHPVGFRATLFPALRALAGDEGARQVVRAHRDRVLQLPVLDAGVLLDVDTPAALAAR